MTNIIASLLLSLSFVACSSDPEPSAPDAALPPTTIPSDPAGTFAVSTTLDVSPPASAALVIAALDRAASQPSKFILEKMIATLPAGATKTVATVALPFVAPYLDVRLAEFAPRFVPGVRAIATGFARIAGHADLLEVWKIDANGAAIRTVAGVRFDVGAATPIAFADIGVSDVSAATTVELDVAGKLTFAHHPIAIRYGAMVRAGLDIAVVPTAEPTAHDVAQALAAMVDCTRLGQLAADKVGLGSPLLYRSACVAAMVAVAAELDEHVVAIDVAPMVLTLTGTAIGVDGDHDGTMNAIKSGHWTGAATHAGATQPIAGTFAGGAP
jgi:hypothetical protein